MSLEIQNIRYKLRKRSVDEIFDLSLLVIARNFRYFLICAPAPFFFAALNIYLIRIFDPDSSANFFSGASWKMLLVLFFEQSLVSLPFTILNGRLLFEERPSFRDLLSDFWNSAPSYFIYGCLLRPLSFFVPRFQMGPVRRMFVGEVLCLEKLKGRIAFQRMSGLSTRSDRVTGFLFLSWGIGLLFLAIGLSTWNFLIDLLAPDSKLWLLAGKYSLLTPAAQILIFLYFGFHATSRFLFYIDVRSEMEGWDLEILLRKGAVETCQ